MVRLMNKLDAAFSNFDLLGHEVRLNVGGKTHVKSKLGSLVTVLLGFVCFAYSVIRFQQLISREEVDVSRIELFNAMDPTQALDL